MSDYSARSQELAKQLREKALRNLNRSAASGKFVSKEYARHRPMTTVSEKHGSGRGTGTK